MPGTIGPGNGLGGGIERLATSGPSSIGGRANGEAPKIRPTIRRTLRALGGRRVVIEGFGKYSPTLVVIGGSEAPAGAWLSPVELRRFVEVARRILK